MGGKELQQNILDMLLKCLITMIKMILKSMTQHGLILLYASISRKHWGRRDISGTSFRHDCWPEKDFNEITSRLYCLSQPFSIQAQFLPL